MSREIWVPHSFLVLATPARARKSRWFPFRTETPVLVPETPAFEAEKALVVGYDRQIQASGYKHASWARPAAAPKSRKKVWTAGNRSIGPSPVEGKERVTEWLGGHEGRLYRPLRAPEDRNAPLTVERMLQGSGDEAFRDHPFLSYRARKGFDRLGERDDAAMARLRNIHVDTEDEAKARVARVASDLLIVDGALWRAQPYAFVVSLATGPKSAEVSLTLEKPWFGSAASGIHFPIDRYPEALDFAESLATAAQEGGPKRKLKLDYRSVDGIDPGFAGLDVPGFTARALVNAAHALAKAEVEARGSGMAVAEPMMEALGGKQPYRSLHLVGNPFDFADRLVAWADEARTLPADQWQRDRLLHFAQGLDDLATPILHGRDRGLSADADAAFFNEEDLKGFTMFDSEEEDAFAP